MRKNVLSSTLHDPKGSLLDGVREAAHVVGGLFDNWTVNVTSQTHADVKEALHAEGVLVTNSVPGQLSKEPIENDHLTALMHGHELACKNDAASVQYTDGDRIIMAANFFPDDLANSVFQSQDLLKTSGQKDGYVNLRRDAKAYLAHHSPLVQTEFEFNRLYSLAFNMPLDIGSTGHVMTPHVAERILRRSPALGTVQFPHPKWLIAAREMGVPIRELLTNNILTFETPMQFRKEIEAEVEKRGGVRLKIDGTKHATPVALQSHHLDDYHLLTQAYSATLGTEGPMSAASQAEWKRRFFLANQYIEVLRDHLAICVNDPAREQQVREEIEKSLSRLETQEGVIIDSLENPAIQNEGTPLDIRLQNSINRPLKK